jgi:hypothetical protein
VSGVDDRSPEVLGVVTSGTDGAVGPVPDGTAADQRRGAAPILDALEKPSDQQLRPTRLRVGEITPRSEDDAHSGYVGPRVTDGRRSASQPQKASAQSDSANARR